MTNTSRSPMFIALLFAITCLLPGCGGGDSRPQGHAVSGTVTLDGEKLAQAEIEFSPKEPGPDAGPSSFGQVTDGQYSITANLGPLAGTSMVTVTISEFDENGEAVDQKYFQTEYNVSDDAEQTFDISIESSTLVNSVDPEEEE